MNKTKPLGREGYRPIQPNGKYKAKRKKGRCQRKKDEDIKKKIC
jgi:hypothetical protein